MTLTAPVLLVIALFVVAVVSLIFALRYILHRHMIMASAHIQRMSADYARRQEELKKRLAESDRQYREQLARAQREAERMLTEAKQEADSMRSRTLEEARLESERIVQQALASRDGLRRELEGELEKRALARACELLQASLPDAFRAEVQANCVNELCQNGMAELDRVKKTTDRMGKAEVRVVSAMPLTAAQRDMLKKKLKAKLAQDVKFTEGTTAGVDNVQALATEALKRDAFAEVGGHDYYKQ